MSIMNPAAEEYEHFAASDGAVLRFRRRGSGPPLILVHGWSQSGAMFRHQLDALSHGFTVIVPDVRGHGGAAVPAGGLRMARLAADLSELIAHLGLGPVDLLGWSMGVSVIWSYVDLFGTGGVRRFVFVDQPAMLTVLPGMDADERAACGCLFTPGELADLYAALLGPDGEAMRAGFVRGMVTPGIPDDLLTWILAENAQTPLAVAAALLISHATNDWRDVLDRIDRPALVIAGTASHVDPRSQRYIAGRIAGARYHEFSAAEGGAHFPFLEAPEPFNHVVGSFLAHD
jgi:pimeloyl-ACP methyl ester carboxylesterase